MMNYFLVYALASWTYSAIDMWRRADEIRAELEDVCPEVGEMSTAAYWSHGALALATAPLFMPFVMLEHLCVALGGVKEEG